MKNIKRSLLAVAIIAALCLPLLSGCNKSTLANMVIKKGTSEVVKYGVKKYPDAKPYVQASGEVICSAAAGTNVSPDAIMTAIENSTAANAVKTDGGLFVMNMVIAAYSGAWEVWGDDAVSNSPTAKAYLQSVCDGINDGLAGRTRAMKRYLQ